MPSIHIRPLESSADKGQNVVPETHLAKDNITAYMIPIYFVCLYLMHWAGKYISCSMLYFF
jgi:predicted FMN-binding regulatory protein PaiB